MGLVRAVLVAALAYNGLVALVFAYDKARARRQQSRVPERTLMLLAALFGAPGALLAMRAFRHKTRKPLFAIGVPVLLVAQLGAIGAAILRS